MKFCLLMVLLFSFTTAQARSSSEAGAVTITAVGDIMMGTDFPEDRLRGDGGRDLFKYTREYFQASDIAFGNLEGTLYDGPPTEDSKGSGQNRYAFRTPTSYGQWLSEAGFNVVSLANNHAMDFGAAGISSTKHTLQQLGIQYSSKKPGEVASFSAGGLKVALIAVDFYSGSRSLRTPRSTLQEIRSLKRTYDVVIVSAHAGAEGISAARIQAGDETFLGENRGDSVSFAHQAIEAGAALILMHGPHVPRAMEIYQQHLVVYSLGNFITERGIDIQSDQGLAPVVQIKLDGQGRFVTGALTSFRQTREYGTIYDPSGAALRKIQKLSELDFPDSMPQFDLETGRFNP